MAIWAWLNRVPAAARRARSRRRTAQSLRDAYAQYGAATRAWLSALRDLTVEMAPELGLATRLRFSLQLAYLDRRDVRFLHLLENSPDRLHTTGSLSEFVGAVDTCWTGEDDGLLNRLRPDYEELCAMIARVKAKAEEGFEGFRDHLNAISHTERSAALLDSFRHEIERIERDVWSR